MTSATHRKLRRSKVFAVIMSSMFVFSCAKSTTEAIQFAEGNTAQKVEPDEPTRPECEVKYYDLALDLDLYSYEFVGKQSFGFNLKSKWFEFLELEYEVDKARLFMEVKPSNPYENEMSLLAKADDKDVKFGMKINFGKIAGGFTNYQTTPVAKLTRAGLMNAVNAVVEKTLTKSTYKEWSTRVISVPADQPNKVVIQAGGDAGIQEGDLFEVFNIRHNWAGRACDSDYQGFDSETDWDKPVAILKANRSVVTARQFATLTITDDHISNQKIEPGAFVRQVRPAKGKKLRPLARSVKIRSIHSGPLVLKNNEQIDLVSYMKRQIDDVLQDKKWKGRLYKYQGQ